MKRVRLQMQFGILEYMLLLIVKKYLFSVKLLEQFGYFIAQYK